MHLNKKQNCSYCFVLSTDFKTFGTTDGSPYKIFARSINAPTIFLKIWSMNTLEKALYTKLENLKATVNSIRQDFSSSFSSDSLREFK